MIIVYYGEGGPGFQMITVDYGRGERGPEVSK